MEEKDEALAVLRQRALAKWQPIPWTIVRAEPNAVEATVSELPESGGWVMGAAARQAPTVSRLTTAAWLERGRDGIDLPLAALVAEAVTATAGREDSWMELEGAVGHVVMPAVEPLLGAGCSLVSLPIPWHLDPGWRALGSVPSIDGGEASQQEAATAREAAAVAPGPGAIVLNGRFGGTEAIPAGRGLTPESPALVVLFGGATLDARYRGDFYGVIAVDDGSVLLDGTTLHGALFVTGTVSLGYSGRLAFSRSILRWATDRSLSRARLVPGTRWEGIE